MTDQTRPTPIPTGCLYAIENWGGEYAVARYAETSPGHYSPEWQDMSAAEYRRCIGNMADYESTEQPCHDMRFYDLQKQQDAITRLMEDMAELNEQAVAAQRGVL